MKQRIYRIRNKRLVQGDSNLLDTNEILVKEDEVGVRLLQREGAEVKDIAYNPADKPVVPEDPYENVIWGRVHYMNDADEFPNGRNFTPYILFQYTEKYRYIFRVRRPYMAKEFISKTDLDIRIKKGREIFGEYHLEDIEFDTLYFCDTKGNVSKVPREKTYRVRNCGGELLDSLNYEFIAENSVRFFPPSVVLNPGATGKFNRTVSVHYCNYDRTFYHIIHKNNRLNPGVFTEDGTNIVGYIRVNKHTSR